MNGMADVPVLVEKKKHNQEDNNNNNNKNNGFDVYSQFSFVQTQITHIPQCYDSFDSTTK